MPDGKTKKPGSKCVLLDRDKTVLMPYGAGYIYRPGDFHIPDGYAEALLKIQSAGYLLFIVTNQGRVARGCLSESDVKKVHAEMDAYFRERGVRFSGFHYCPHNPAGTVAPYNRRCGHRKPGTKMIEKIVARHGIDPGASWMIGDSENDVTAGIRSGLSTIRICGGTTGIDTAADFVADDLIAAVKTVLKNQKQNPGFTVPEGI